jgi:hypothetical protein
MAEAASGIAGSVRAASRIVRPVGFIAEVDTDGDRAPAK